MGKKDKKEGKRSKGSKIHTNCRKCGVEIVTWTNLDPVCIKCAIWK